MKRLAAVCLILSLAGLGWAFSSAKAAERLMLAAQTRSATRKASPERAKTVTGTVRGRAVLANGNSFRGIRVRVGNQSVVTASDGRFEFSNVPATYDLTLSTFDSRVVTAYFGLTRRDPIVTHTAQTVRSSREGDTYHANIVAGFEIPIGDRVVRPTVFYFSPWTFWTEDRLHRLDLAWSGDRRTEGTLVALTVGEAKPYLGTAPVTLVDGKTSDPRLHFSPIAMGRIAGTARAVARPVRDGNSLVLENETFRISYAIPRTIGAIDLGDCGYRADSFNCQVPDLKALGGEYCISILFPRPYGVGPFGVERVRANRCGGKIGMTDFSILPSPPAPVLKVAPAGTETEEIVSWTGPGDPLCELSIGWLNDRPAAVVYLNKNRLSWSDFEALGLKYAPNTTAYFQGAAFHPHRAVDDFASSIGRLGDRSTWDRVESKPIGIVLPDSPESALVEDRAFTVEDARKLPTCAANIHTQPVEGLGLVKAETRVSVRGILTLGDLGCTLAGCGDDHRGPCCINTCSGRWTVESPNDRTQRVGLIQHMHPMGLVANECEHPGDPRVEVIATGTLIPPNSLDDAVLCAVQATSPPAGK